MSDFLANFNLLVVATRAEASEDLADKLRTVFRASMANVSVRTAATRGDAERIIEEAYALDPERSKRKSKEFQATVVDFRNPKSSEAGFDKVCTNVNLSSIPLLHVINDDQKTLMEGHLDRDHGPASCAHARVLPPIGWTYALVSEVRAATLGRYINEEMGKPGGTMTNILLNMKINHFWIFLPSHTQDYIKERRNVQFPEGTTTDWRQTRPLAVYDF